MGKSAVIYCSSLDHPDPLYDRVARDVVRMLGEKGWSIVSGGSFRGNMGSVSSEALAAGVPHRGVIPRFMKQFVFGSLTETVFTDTMADRKEEMRRGTSAAIALPGGIGTLDELIETHVLAKLGQYPGKIIALNVDGFYEPLRALLGHYAATGMTSAQDCALVHFVSSVEELGSLL